MLRGIVAGAVAAACLAACGSSAPAPPSWEAAHPAPAGMTFGADAPGLCVFAVQYPDQAPAVIDYGGATWVQRTRDPAAAPPPQPIARSGDWTIAQTGGALRIYAPGATFVYSASGCGSPTPG